MKLSEIKGEKAIEVFADLLDPVGKILTDEEIVKAFRNDESRIVIVQKMLKRHAKEVIEAMAIIDGTPVEEFKENVDFLTLPSKLMDFFNDEAVSKLFTSQGQKEETKPFGSAMENTEEKEN